MRRDLIGGEAARGSIMVPMGTSSVTRVVHHAFLTLCRADSSQLFQLSRVADERNHDACFDIDLALYGHFASCLYDRLNLHLVDLRVGEPQAAATVAKHGVYLFEALCSCLERFKAHAQLIGELSDLFVALRQNS